MRISATATKINEALVRFTHAYASPDKRVLVLLKGNQRAENKRFAGKKPHIRNIQN